MDALKSNRILPRDNRCCSIASAGRT